MWHHPLATSLTVSCGNQHGFSMLLYTIARKEVIEFNMVVPITFTFQQNQTVRENGIRCRLHHPAPISLDNRLHHLIAFRDRHHLFDLVPFFPLHSWPPVHKDDHFNSGHHKNSFFFICHTSATKSGS